MQKAEDIMKVIENVEHPEISETLVNLGMIADIVLEEKTARIAVFLPVLGIPDTIKKYLVQSLEIPVHKIGMGLEVEFFPMTPEMKQRFISIAQAKWKGSK